jgi:oxygen-independent coproporphyrinogen-3 oxidase
MCLYCGCTAIASKTGRGWTPYMTRLTRELEMLSEALGPRTLGQLHWGGGTPSWLPFDQAERFFGHLASAFPLEPDAEVAIEIDPRTLRPGQLGQLRGLGFNRVSFGVQDLSPAVQSAVGRLCSETMAAHVIAEAHALDFDSVNVDLMYGLPRQTVASFQHTVSTVAKWRPSRIALFGYAHVPWMRPHQRLLPEEELPSARERVRLFAAAIAVLEANGYVHLGLDHFVLPTDALALARSAGQLYRNFQGYSIRRGRDLVGLGMSAIGFVAGSYLANHRRLRSYQYELDGGRLPIERTYTPTRRERAVAGAIDAVMCHGHLELEHASAEFGGPDALYGAGVWDRLGLLEADGLIVRSGASIEVTPAGRVVLRHVAAARAPMLDDDDAAKERFSRGL